MSTEPKNIPLDSMVKAGLSLVKVLTAKGLDVRIAPGGPNFTLQLNGKRVAGTIKLEPANQKAFMPITLYWSYGDEDSNRQYKKIYKKSPGTLTEVINFAKQYLIDLPRLSERNALTAPDTMLAYKTRAVGARMKDTVKDWAIKPAERQAPKNSAYDGVRSRPSHNEASEVLNTTIQQAISSDPAPEVAKPKPKSKSHGLGM